MLLNKPRHLLLTVTVLCTIILGLFWFVPFRDATFRPYLYPKNGFTSILTTGATGKGTEKAPKIEVDGLSLGLPFSNICADGSSDICLEQVNDELLHRLQATEVDTSHPKCSIDLARYETVLRPPSSLTANSGTKRHVTIALNLYNSQDILPSLSLALLELIFHLKRTEHRVYISVFENDSKDKTLPILGDLGAALIALKIDGLYFRHSALGRIDGVERIRGLASLRNEALFPLFDDAGEGIVLFVNDVVTCASDLLEVVNQLRLQDAHAAMSTDWDFSQTDPPAIRFRDLWVMRGVNGEMPYIMDKPGGYSIQAPTGSFVADLFLTQNAELHQRYLEGKPVPVYSGWNGAIAFDAKLFTELHMRFRGSAVAKWTGGDASGALGKWGELLATPGYLESDCAASECKLFARDAWNLLEGRARILVAPQSRTGYTLTEFNFILQHTPVTRRTGPDGPEELIDWTNVTMPSKVVCVPNLDANGGGIVDLWGEDQHRKYLDPRVQEWV